MSSSGGALLSLAARGPQDVFLTGNPDTSYFRQVYRRHTNFAMSTLLQHGEGAIASGNITRYTLSRQGDMVSGLYLKCTEKGAGGMRDNIDYVRLLVGGREIVKMTGGEDGDLEKYQSLMSNTYCKGKNADHGQLSDFAPLHFWFCEYWGAALPICALTYHDVVVEVKWAGDPDVANNHTFELWAKMIWLGNEERDYFVKAPKLTYLIDQWQNSDPIGRTDAGNARYSMDLEFNHPVKVIIINVNSGTGVIAKRSKLLTLATDNVVICKLRQDQLWFNMYYYSPNGAFLGNNQYPIIPFALNLGSNQPSWNHELFKTQQRYAIE